MVKLKIDISISSVVFLVIFHLLDIKKKYFLDSLILNPFRMFPPFCLVIFLIL